MFGHSNRGVGFPLAPIIVIACCAVAAIYLGTLIGGSEMDELLMIGIALGMLSVLGFVGDYWWAPLLLISALTFRTNFLGFMMTGVDIGIVVLAVLLPLKIAIRRLRLAQPAIPLGRVFWALTAYLIVHAVVIILYSKFDGVPLKNIIKAYYAVISPLVFYVLLIRYCRPSTVKPVAKWMFGMYAFVVAVSIPVILTGVRIPLIGSRHFMFDWTAADDAALAVRGYSPLLLAAAVAFWPASRSFLMKCLLLLGSVIAVLAALISAGRVTTIMCLAELVMFCFLRRKPWLMMPAVAVLAILSFAISANPNALYALPDSAHRALTPFNFSEHRTDIQNGAEVSNRWHEELRSESIPYWTSDLNSFFFGHGFKAWDESLDIPEFTRYYDDAKRLAIQMGRTENAFNSITNVFGLVGLLLYGWLGFHLIVELRRARKVVPPSSFARALCDFSLVSVITFILFAPIAGGPPGINIIYWLLGILAARPMLAAAVAHGTSAESFEHTLRRPSLVATMR
jgi:hypothetical protein